jgi:small-conductance mechanosensitive channel
MASMSDQMTRYMRNEWIHILLPAGVLLCTLLAVFVARRIFFAFLARIGARSSNKSIPIVISSMHGPIMIWGLILGLHLATQSSRLPTHWLHLIARSLLVLWILSLTIMAARLAGNLVKYYGGRIGGEMPATSLTRSLTQIFVAMIGALILLNQLGISITPLLTALGVGGLAVALALQDTLSNLFAGFYISLAGQLRLSDYIRLNSGEEGFVTDINWRSTTIRTLATSMIIIPNAKLAQAIVTNFNLPTKSMAVPVTVGVSYECDADHVEAVLLDEAVRAAAELPGLLAEPAPTARLMPGFGDWALQFTLTVHVNEFAQQFRVQSELRKRILKRFRREKIEMPYPTQTVISAPTQRP